MVGVFFGTDVMYDDRIPRRDRKFFRRSDLQIGVLGMDLSYTCGKSLNVPMLIPMSWGGRPYLE